MLNLSMNIKLVSRLTAVLTLCGCFSLINISISQASGKALWEQYYGGGKRDKAFAIKSLADGGSIISGYTRSRGTGDSDVWVMRLDGFGKVLWEQTFDNGGREVSTAVTNLKNGGFMVVANGQNAKSAQNFAWLIRLDKYGNKVWDKKYTGAGNGKPYAIVAMKDGGAVIAGLTYKKGKANEYDGWVLRINKNGKKIWERIYGTKGKDWLRSLALLPNGDIVVVGAKQYKVVKAALTPTNLTGKEKSLQTAWGIRLKANGKTVWDKTFYSGENVARSVAVQKNGHIAIAGWTRGVKIKGHYGKDSWVISLNGKGVEQWKKIFGGAGEDKSDGITVLGDGTLAMVCITQKRFPMMTVNSAWVLALDSKGKILWERSYGSGRADQLHAITTLTDGRIAVAGGTWRSGKGTDAWVFTLSKTGQTPTKNKIH